MARHELMHCQPLIQEDINFSGNDLVVRAGKRAKDRNTTFPALLNAELQNQRCKATTIHDKELRGGCGASTAGRRTWPPIA